MSLSSLTVGLLLLAAGPGQADPTPPHAINRRDFKIPIVIPAEQRALMKELILYVSADQGKTWQQTATAAPDKDHFRFFASGDGLYWFTVVVVDQQNHRQPEDIYTVPPSQKILVDSIRPVVQITMAEREGEEVMVGWDIRDDSLDAGTLRLEYRAFDAPAQSLWQTVPVSPVASGQTRFRPNYTGPLVVRIEVKDRAGNSGSAQKDVPPAAGGQSANATPIPPAPAPQPNPNYNNAALPPGAQGNSPLNGGANYQNTARNDWPRPVYSPSGYPPTGQPSYPQAFPAAQPPYPPNGFPPGPPLGQQYPPAGQQYPPPYPPTGHEGDEQRLVAVSPGGVQPTQPGVTPTTSSPLMPPPRVVNDPRIALEYEVKCGTSGVAKVELWISQDEGRTWRYFTDDPTVGSPIEATLPGEGIFGLKLVVHSGAGLSKGPPQPGDPPDLRIEVDSTPPLVQMYEPKPDPRRRDTLNISWNATDRNLMPRPVTLEWSDRPEGPWRLIATDLPSTGSHPWQLTAEIPFQVLLRATAVDTAGNRGVAETRDKLLVDLNKPEGRILGIVPVNRSAPSRP